jgi:hypothetical protein
MIDAAGYGLSTVYDSATGLIRTAGEMTGEAIGLRGGAGILWDTPGQIAHTTHPGVLKHIEKQNRELGLTTDTDTDHGLGSRLRLAGELALGTTPITSPMLGVVAGDGLTSVGKGWRGGGGFVAQYLPQATVGAVKEAAKLADAVINGAVNPEEGEYRVRSIMRNLAYAAAEEHYSETDIFHGARDAITGGMGTLDPEAIKEHNKRYIERSQYFYDQLPRSIRQLMSLREFVREGVKGIGIPDDLNPAGQAWQDYDRMGANIIGARMDYSAGKMALKGAKKAYTDWRNKPAAPAVAPSPPSGSTPPPGGASAAGPQVAPGAGSAPSGPVAGAGANAQINIQSRPSASPSASAASVAPPPATALSRVKALLNQASWKLVDGFAQIEEADARPVESLAKAAAIPEAEFVRVLKEVEAEKTRQLGGDPGLPPDTRPLNPDEFDQFESTFEDIDASAPDRLQELEGAKTQSAPPEHSSPVANIKVVEDRLGELLGSVDSSDPRARALIAEIPDQGLRTSWELKLDSYMRSKRTTEKAQKKAALAPPDQTEPPVSPKGSYDPGWQRPMPRPTDDALVTGKKKKPLVDGKAGNEDWSNNVWEAPLPDLGPRNHKADARRLGSQLLKVPIKGGKLAAALAKTSDTVLTALSKDPGARKHKGYLEAIAKEMRKRGLDVPPLLVPR